MIGTELTATGERLPDVRPNERRILHLLAQIPLLTADELARLDGRAGPAGVYRLVARLDSARLVASVTPRVSGKSPARHFLTARGIAVVARDAAIGPGVLTKRHGLGHDDLAARLRAQPGHTGLIRLLVFIATSERAGRGASLLSCESPWRRSLLRPTAKRPVPIEIPGAVTLGHADGTRASFLLLPDPGYLAVRAYGAMISRLYDLRAIAGVRLPTLAIATSAERLALWRDLIESARARRGEAYTRHGSRAGKRSTHSRKARADRPGNTPRLTGNGQRARRTC
jgi:hypothetical protein